MSEKVRVTGTSPASEPVAEQRHRELGSAVTALLMAVGVGFACQGMGAALNRILAAAIPTAQDKAVFLLLLGVAVLGVDFLLYELNYGTLFSRASIQLNGLNAGLTVALATIVADSGFQALPGSLRVIAGLGATQAALYFLNWVVLLRRRLSRPVRIIKGISNGLVIVLSVILWVLAGRTTAPAETLWSVVLWFAAVVTAYTVVGWAYLFRPDATDRVPPTPSAPTTPST